MQDRPITRNRGDEEPVELNVFSAGVVLPIDGFSFVLTVNRKAAPTAADADEFSSTGSLVDPGGGIVHFPIGPGAADLVGRFYYIIRMTDASGKDKGIRRGTWLSLPTAEKPSGTPILDDYVFTPAGVDDSELDHGGDFLLYWEEGDPNPWKIDTHDGRKVFWRDSAILDSGVYGFKPYDEGPIPITIARGQGIEVLFWIGPRNILRLHFPMMGGFYEFGSLTVNFDMLNAAGDLTLEMEASFRSGEYFPDGDTANDFFGAIGAGWYRGKVIFGVEDLSEPGAYYNAAKVWPAATDEPTWEDEGISIQDDDNGIASPWFWYANHQRNSLGSDELRIAEIRIFRSGITDFDLG